ncbi:hypothetical protein [Nitrobacter sp. TKz-YC02]|uniref:hypothetical protein n=1 Tax=Nitrobacter sp. TKz-YC02 TaxID=3398704 RepID=UPI003CF61F3A
MSNQNEKNPDLQQQNQSQTPSEQADEDEIRMAEIRKAVRADMIDPKHPQGQQDTEYSGGT